MILLIFQHFYMTKSETLASDFVYSLNHLRLAGGFFVKSGITLLKNINLSNQTGDTEKKLGGVVGDHNCPVDAGTG